MNKWVVSIEGINEVVNKCESLLIEMDNGCRGMRESKIYRRNND